MRRLTAMILAALLLASSIPASMAAWAAERVATGEHRPGIASKALQVPMVRLIAPKRLLITPEVTSLFIDETLTLTANPVPLAATAAVKWTSSKPLVASIDAEGRVTAHKAGVTTIRARSTVRASVTATRVMTVTADPARTSLALAGAAGSMHAGDQAILRAVTEPEETGLTIRWSSSDESVLTVENGRVWARRPGRATVTASIEGGPSASHQIDVAVAEMVTEIPARTTSLDHMAENLKRIDAVHRSTRRAINELLNQGMISPSDAQRRITAMARAFAMYRFPWMTEQTQKYWTNAYGTRKDFKPGLVYYGLPYIQRGKGGNSINRTYNDVKAVAQGYYVDSGRGYLLLSPNRRRDGMYVGNDCSSFVGMSLWGGSNRNAFLRTRALHTSSQYQTLPNYAALRPGDILVKYNSHVVFFLYYTDPAGLHMMILEQGGGTNDDLHNTVTCSVRPTAYYRGNNFRPRRLRSLG